MSNMVLILNCWEAKNIDSTVILRVTFVFCLQVINATIIASSYLLFFKCTILAQSLNSSTGPEQRAQNKAESTRDHDGRQQSKLEVRRNTSGARATAADYLATLLPTRLLLFAKHQGLGASRWQLKVGAQSVKFQCCCRCGLERPIVAHAADATDVQILNATINYILNTCNRFRGCGGGRNNHTACVMTVRPYLRFKI